MPRGGDALALLRIRARTHQAAPLSWSIDLGTRKPDDTAPLLEFACREARELRLCHDQRVNAHRCKPGLEISRLDDFVASFGAALQDMLEHLLLQIERFVEARTSIEADLTNVARF